MFFPFIFYILKKKRLKHFYNNYGMSALIIYFYYMLIDTINRCIYVC